MIKEALQYFAEQVIDANGTEVTTICGHVYANRKLERYDKSPMASALEVTSLQAVAEYIKECLSSENLKVTAVDRNLTYYGPDHFILHIQSPTNVRLLSFLNEDRNREELIHARALISSFKFDQWYDQERFMIETQANFVQVDPDPETEDMILDPEDSAQAPNDINLLLKFAGNVKKTGEQAYSDNGTMQTATMQTGVAAKEEVIVPNPLTLIPYRTFQEVEQPSSRFIFRINDNLQMKLISADNGMWMNEAVLNIKRFFAKEFEQLPEELRNKVVIIG
jgi:hypothetical protein